MCGATASAGTLWYTPHAGALLTARLQRRSLPAAGLGTPAGVAKALDGRRVRGHHAVQREGRHVRLRGRLPQLRRQRRQRRILRHANVTPVCQCCTVAPKGPVTARTCHLQLWRRHRWCHTPQRICMQKVTEEAGAACARAVF